MEDKQRGFHLIIIKINFSTDKVYLYCQHPGTLLSFPHLRACTLLPLPRIIPGSDSWSPFAPSPLSLSPSAPSGWAHCVPHAHLFCSTSGPLHSSFLCLYSSSLRSPHLLTSSNSLLSVPFSGMHTLTMLLPFAAFLSLAFYYSFLKYMITSFQQNV